MESNPLRGLFGVSSPRPVEQRVYFEVPSGMLEKLLANPFAGDGKLHPTEHLIYVIFGSWNHRKRRPVVGTTHQGVPEESGVPWWVVLNDPQV